MKETLILASRNKGKIKEIEFLLKDSPYAVIGMEAAGFTDDIEETGTTLEENAAIKARYLHNKTGQAVLAEDSGLFVDALNGAPGIWSARYAGSHGNDKANLQLVLQNMEGQTNRTAHFAACLCFIDHHGTSHFFKGSLHGTITHEPIGQNGFGYDPIFIPDGYEVTNAQLNPAVKNSMSHRAEAIGKWLGYLKS